MRGGDGRPLLMRRVWGQQPQQAVECQVADRLPAERQVAEVRRVESAAKKSDEHGAKYITRARGAVNGMEQAQYFSIFKPP